MELAKVDQIIQKTTKLAHLLVQRPTTVPVFFSIPSIGATTCEGKAEYWKVLVVPAILYSKNSKN